MVFVNTDPNGNDVARAVDHRQPSVQQQLSHVFDVSLMGSAQSLAFWALQHTHRFQSPRQHHGRQGGSEDETGGVGAHSIHQGGSAGYVTTHTAKCFTYRYFKQYQQSWEARTQMKIQDRIMHLILTVSVLPRVPETISILCMTLSLSPTPAPWAPYSPTAWTSSTKVRAPYYVLRHTALQEGKLHLRNKLFFS